MNRSRVLVSWSSGKDSAWMLHTLQQSEEFEIVGLFTTFNVADRVAMHAVRRSFVKSQAANVGFPDHWWWSTHRFLGGFNISHVYRSLGLGFDFFWGGSPDTSLVSSTNGRATSQIRIGSSLAATPPPTPPKP